MSESCAHFSAIPCPIRRGGIRGDSEANARRIVAAWNAVEGITTEALEAGVVRELVEIAHITRILITDWLENSDCDCSVESARLHVCGRTEVEADLSRVDGLLSKLRGGTDA